MAQDNEQQPTEKKIIIDEDWKAQVQAEKVQPQTPQSERATAKRAKQALPPATISFLFTTLATQALIALGSLPHPASNQLEKDLDQAKLFIDTLGVLEEKTKGNLTADEKRQIDAILFDLRMQFIEAGSSSPSK